MGNQPSAVESRGRLPAPHHVPHKLSKPRTGNHTANRLSQLSIHAHASHKTRSSSPPAPTQLSEPLSSPVQLEAPLPHPPPPILGSRLTTTTASAPPHHRPDWDYSFDDATDNLPTLGGRRSLFRSKSVNPEVQKGRHHKRRNSGGLKRRKSVAYERGENYYGEAITENWAVYPTQRRKPINYDLLSYEAQRLLNISEQQQAFGEEGSDMSETREVSEITWKSSNPHVPSAKGSVHNGEFGGVTRVNSDLSMYTMPMRRQSLRQPGIATRSSVGINVHETETLVRRHSRTSTPDHLRRASFLIGDDDDDDMCQPLPPRFLDPDQPRLSTPCEDDYKQIGAFKLGSLRIVNGAASPSPMGSPSERKARGVNGEETPTKKQKLDGYFTRRLEKTGSKFLSPKPETEGGEEEEDASEEPPPPLPKDVTRIQSPTPSRPLLSPVAATFRKLDSGISSGSSKQESPRSPKLPKAQPQANERSGGSSLRIELSSEYLTALEFSSLTLECASSEELKTTSKHTALEDQLFEDDPASDVFSTGPEVLEVRNDPSAKPSRAPAPQRPKLDRAQRGSRTVSRSDSGFVGSPTSDGASTHRSSGTSAVSRLTKADSGYSSNVSLRSFQSNSNHNSLTGKPPVPEKDFPRRHPSSIASLKTRGSFIFEDPRLSSPDGSVLGAPESDKSEIPGAPDREAPPPPVPEKDFPPQSTSTSMNSSRFSRGSGQAKIALIQSRMSRSRQFMTPSPIPSRTASEPLMVSRIQKLPSNSPLSPLSPASGWSPTASPALAPEKPKRPGKLRKLLGGSGLRSRTSKPDLGLHPNHHLDLSQIPKVPKQAEASLSQHVTQYPSTSQRLALKARNSKDTLVTIPSIASGGAGPPEGERPPSEKTRKTKKIPEALVIPERRNTTSGDVFRKQMAQTRRERRHDPPPLSHRNTIHETNFSHLQLPPLQSSASYSNLDSAYASGVERDNYFSTLEEPRRIAASVGRTTSTTSMTSEAERTIYMRVAAQRKSDKEARASSSRASSMTGCYDPLSPIGMAPSPIAAYHRARAISRSGSLRVPLPLRPQSIPMSQNQREALSRKSSRDAIHSFPSSTPNSDDMGFAAPSRSSSRVSMRSASVAPPIPPYNPKTSTSSSRANSISSDTGGSNWQPMLARHGSVSSYSEVGGYATTPPSRPASAAGYCTMSLGAPPLSHRSSYDGQLVGPGDPGYFEVQKQQLAADLGAGRHTVYSSVNADPWSAGHVCYGPGPFPWDQYGQGTSMQGRHPPYVPRQKRSSSQMRPGNVPYRVLHSYNSPAYKGAPIWG